jgi:hypothetical protein
VKILSDKTEVLQCWKGYFSALLNDKESLECEGQHLDLQGIDTKENPPPQNMVIGRLSPYQAANITE